MPVLDGRRAEAIERATLTLVQGGLVAFATETVYGLGARADDDEAVAGIFAAKGRPSEHPLIVHVADIAQARHFAATFEGAALRLAQSFWPGPVTVIVRRVHQRAAAAAGGQDSIGLRCPAHPVARALIQRCAEKGIAGIAAPSANRFGRISPTTAQHVVDEFGDGLLVLDGGACEVGIESTIVDCSRGRPVLLRPGVLTREAVQAALGEPLAAPDVDAPRASGTLAAHYAPRAGLRLVEASALRRAGALPPGVAVYSRTRWALPAGVRWRAMPEDAAGAARELFAALRWLDAPEVQQIWVEQPPATPEWEGVRDRLQRAAAAT